MPTRDSARGRKAFNICRGFGLEIGALHDPFDLDAKVLYLDYLDTAGLRKRYAGDARQAMIRDVDLIASRPPYAFLGDGVFDFVISSHVLEHMPNPGLALEEWTRIVREDGVVYSILPNKELTFDVTRATTPVDVLMEAFFKREETAAREQYFDFFLHKRLENGERRRSEEEIDRLWRRQDSIHVYTFTPQTIVQFVEELSTHIGFRVEYFEVQGIDMHLVLRKA